MSEQIGETKSSDGKWRRPRLSVRWFLVVSGLLGALVLPWAWRKYQEYDYQKRVDGQMRLLAGNWQLITFDDMDVSGDNLIARFRGSRLALDVGNFEPPEQAEFRLDLNVAPIGIDIVDAEGTAHCIYKVQGDSLTILYPHDLERQQRPTSWSPPEGEYLKVELKRLKGPPSLRAKRPSTMFDLPETVRARER